ncbi:ankyrin repeat domain protein : Putative ankyrin repeat domain protein OS=Fimbriimonas ginsengisoli Gsoil 348 GN=OP10G_3819 PE=4 SV=1: Ank [Gemmataceae bacterium]|nr:ankyrin repeat domain protein : Putative ankyrin repeat domain protein OS=Fimbriimonas ginsengisoli Gsoil 348 GN=OP10G_3819 PE=4 SV=1: Ank [Gemmataceae bacterium]VTT98578.1 ankyrin repeat domain protein : Putative ankyrin repeat domain protein OS=Fimbriimonas ginsengisoli Gsoil 348 GN=OP10G_3819 PE=4 SV=1: Ank [Gemmataceae bacterium]
MPDPIDRRSFAAFTASVVLGREALAADTPDVAPMPHRLPTEAPFTRDYPPPGFNPSWKNPQINRLLVQDFVVFAHMDLGMTKRLLEREPGLLHATVNWGAGDWETALGAASHMGRHDIVEYLLENGARIDIFCAAMMGQLDAVRAFLTLQPKLIDAKGPHGFALHFHAQVGGDRSAKVLDYLQSVKKLDLKPVPFLKKPADKTDPPKKPADQPKGN